MPRMSKGHRPFALTASAIDLGLVREIEREPDTATRPTWVVVHAGEPRLAQHLGKGRVHDSRRPQFADEEVVATLAGIAGDRGALDLDGVIPLLTTTHEHGTRLRLRQRCRAHPRLSVADAVGEPLAEFARANLFRAARDRRPHWPRNPDGRDYGFGHPRLRPPTSSSSASSTSGEAPTAAVRSSQRGSAEARGRRHAEGRPKARRTAIYGGQQRSRLRVTSPPVTPDTR